MDLPVTIRNQRVRARHAVLLICIFYFVFMGLLVIPYPGVETDEALFASGIFAPASMAGHFELFGQPVVLMLMSYLGGLKAWLYTPILALVDASPWSLRLPTLLLGAASILLLFQFLRHAAGLRAALVGAALLAADCTYLLTTALDWGPVALQLTLTLAAVVLILQFFDCRSGWRLAAAFFCAGLALWDKAVFLWLFSGMVVAGALLYFRVIWPLVTARRVLIAGLAFLLGALPFVYYNISNDFITFQGKSYSFNEWEQNAITLKRTFSGYVMSDFLVDYRGEVKIAPELSGRERFQVWLSELTGHPVKGFLPYLAILSLLCLPWAWRSGKGRLLLFLALSAGIAWFQMLITDNAGTSAHHTILIWPYVVGFIAISLDAAMERLGKPGTVALLLAVTLVVGSNVAVMNRYVAGLIVHGAGPMWSDACYALIETIERRGPNVVTAADWGMGDTMRLLLMDRIPVQNAIEPFSRTELDDFERKHILLRVSRPDALFVANVPSRAHFPKGRDLVRRWARENGWIEEPLEVITDRHGREVFEVYRFVPAARSISGSE